MGKLDGSVPGQGKGYTPPMDRTVLRWFIVTFTAIAVLATVVVYTLSRIG